MGGRPRQGDPRHSILHFTYWLWHQHGHDMEKRPILGVLLHVDVFSSDFLVFFEALFRDLPHVSTADVGLAVTGEFRHVPCQNAELPKDFEPLFSLSMQIVKQGGHSLVVFVPNFSSTDSGTDQRKAAAGHH